MLFLKHQVLDLEDIVYVMMPAESLRREGIKGMVSRLERCAARCDKSERALCLIAFCAARREQIAVGISNSEIHAEHDPLIQNQRWLYLENAVKTRFEGPLTHIEDGILSLKEYLKANDLRAATSVYGVFISGVDGQDENREVILDIYVGIDKNVQLNSLM